jgi:hypothetical protein
MLRRAAVALAEAGRRAGRGAPRPLCGSRATTPELSLRAAYGPIAIRVRHPSITRWSSPGTARGESRARSRSDCRRAPLHTLSPPRRRGPGVAGGRRGSRGTGHVVPEADELGWARFYGGVARRARTAPSALGLDQTQKAGVRRFHTRPSGRRYRERIAEMTEIFHGPTHDSGSVRR